MNNNEWYPPTEDRNRKKEMQSFSDCLSTIEELRNAHNPIPLYLIHELERDVIKPDEEGFLDNDYQIQREAIRALLSDPEMIIIDGSNNQPVSNDALLAVYNRVTEVENTDVKSLISEIRANEENIPKDLVTKAVKYLRLQSTRQISSPTIDAQIRELQHLIYGAVLPQDKKTPKDPDLDTSAKPAEKKGKPARERKKKNEQTTNTNPPAPERVQTNPRLTALETQIKSHIEGKVFVPSDLVHEAWTLLNNPRTNTTDEERERFVELMNKEGVKIIQRRNNRLITWNDYLLQDAPVALQLIALMSDLKNAIKNNSPIPVEYLENLHDALKTGNDAFFSELLRNQILSEFKNATKKKGILITLADGTTHEVKSDIFESKDKLPKVEAKIPAATPTVPNTSPANAAPAEAAPTAESAPVADEAIELDPEAFRAQLEVALENVDAHIIEGILEEINHKFDGLSETDKAKFKELFEGLVPAHHGDHEHHEHEGHGDGHAEHPERDLKEMAVLVEGFLKKLTSGEGFEMSKETHDSLIAKFNELKDEMEKVLMSQLDEEKLFKNDPENLKIFKKLKEQEKNGELKCTSEIEKINSALKSSENDESVDDKYRIALLRNKFFEILKYNKLLRDVLSREIEELRRILEEKERVLEEKRVVLEDAKRELDEAVRSKDDVAIKEKSEIYQTLLKEYNKAEAVVEVIKLKITSKVETLKSITEKIEKIEEKTVKMETCTDLSEAEEMTDDAEDVSKEIKHELKPEKRHGAHGHDDHHGHSKSDPLKSTVTWGIVSGGLLIGIFNAFAINLYNTLRGVKGGGSSVENHKSGGHGGGGGHGGH